MSAFSQTGAKTTRSYRRRARVDREKICPFAQHFLTIPAARVGVFGCSMDGMGAPTLPSSIPRVLLVDDDVELAELVAEYLAREGFALDAEEDGTRALGRMASGDYQLTVLDVMLPGVSGFDLLRAIRATSLMPVLMLTARGDDVDRIVGLELGADDVRLVRRTGHRPATPALEREADFMDTRRTLTLTLALGLTLVAGAARADGPGSGFSGEEIGTIRYIDRTLNLIVLTDGAELRAPDPRMLSNLQEGQVVRVDFTHDSERSVINSIEPANTEDYPGASPSTEPGPHFHG
jgi:CheY-like chemotaxis protein